MRPTDALAMSMAQNRKGAELTAVTWPKAPPEARHPTLLRLLSAFATAYAGDRRIGVAQNDGRVGGIVISRSRATGIVWDVEHLIAPNVATAVELLNWACDNAVAAGGRRVFLETPPEGLGADAALRAGFERYSEGTTYRLDPGFGRDKGESLPARPRLSADEQGLFQLYNAAVPAPVRAAEAMTYDEWRALYRGRKAWTPTILGKPDDLVWELGSRIVGWMRIVFGERSQFLELLIHPMYESYADRMVRNALTQTSDKVPVIVDVREYHAAPRAALERAGFRPGAFYTIWVRQLAARVTEAAGAVAQVPV